MQINYLYNNKEKNRIQSASLIVEGVVFYNNKILNKKELSSILDNMLESELCDFFEKINGFYNITYIKNGALFLLTDAVRSMPLYYKCENEQWFVSDSYEKLFPQSFDASIEAELEYAGFISSDRTLDKNIRQVEAGELIRIDSKGIQKIRIWDFLSIQKDEISNSKCRHIDIEKIVDSTIDRFLQVAGNRKILIPLSGGIDSRLLLYAIKLRNPENKIIAFTFGRKDSEEVKISRQIASELNIEWHFIEYTKETWKRISSSRQFREYCKLVHGGVSVPNLQVFPALYELKQLGVICEDTIALPGHAADFVAGSHISPELLSLEERNLPRYLRNKHYSLKRPSGETNQMFDQKVETWVSDLKNQLGEGISVQNLAEMFNHRERQSKFIVNSNKYYEYFGLKWWMPYWDLEFANFWKKISIIERATSDIWSDFVRHYEKANFGKNFPVYGNANKRKLAFVSKLINLVLGYFKDPTNSIYLIPYTRWLSYNFRLSKDGGNTFTWVYKIILKKEKN